jgi:hypothetical protein
MRDGREQPTTRLAALADMQRAVARVDLPDTDKALLIRRIGDLGGLVEADSQVTASMLRSPMPPIQRLSLLLKMAVGESGPTGPCATRAREAAIRLGKSPEIRADLTKSPELLEKLRPLMMAG